MILSIFIKNMGENYRVSCVCIKEEKQLTGPGFFFPCYGKQRIFFRPKESSSWSNLHFLDAIVIHSLDVLCTVDKDERYEMTKSLKHIPAEIAETS